jgi:endonuclease/exonuclease/phosphatase family metal-dependent hydrolase
MPPVRAAAVLVLVLALLPASAAAQAPRSSQVPADVTVMSFNVWLGGDVVDFGNVAEVIRAADADIVGLQEAEGNTRRIAAALGWPYWSDRLHVVSRYPLVDPPEARGEYVLAQVRPGELFALANVHLTSDPYGPYEVRDGRSRARVLRLERGLRLPEMRVTLDVLRAGLPRDMPALLTGDFNTPSHLDWTAAAVGIRPHVRYPLAWPVTRALQGAGFVDTYRAVHPDPVATPGLTWTFGYPFPRLRRGEASDRIDMVHALRPAGVLAAGVVGPPGTPDADFEVDPYPSDHRAVFARVRLVPAAPRAFASVLDRRVVRGEPVGVRYAPPRDERPARIAIVRAGAGPRAPLMWLPPQEAGFYGSVTFGSGSLAPGRYDALVVTRGGSVASRSTFWVVRPGAGPRVRVASEIRAGRPIRVGWRNAPALRRDWIGIYEAGDPDLYNGYLGFAYTGASVTGRTSFAGDAQTYPPGRYVARLMRDDGYGVLAEAPFRIVTG